IFGWGLFHVYDILCAKDFNPNERTGSVFSSSNPKFLLAEQLRRAIFSFYSHHQSNQVKLTEKPATIKELVKTVKPEFIYQCKYCLSVYEEKAGEPENGIKAGTDFEQLSVDYGCPLCESTKDDFIKIEKSALGLQAV
ncbi:MAG: rubredoxin, partial [Chitinophagaceae bacterium]